MQTAFVSLCADHTQVCALFSNLNSLRSTVRGVVESLRCRC